MIIFNTAGNEINVYIVLGYPGIYHTCNTIVHVHKKLFYLCHGKTILNLKVNYIHIGRFDQKALDINIINLSPLNHAETRNRAIICNKYIEKM